MTDMELDTAIELDAERQWEEQNQPTPTDPIESLSTKTRISAFAPLNTARFMIRLVLEDVKNSQELVKNTPQGDKLAGMFDQLCDFWSDLKEIEREIWRCSSND